MGFFCLCALVLSVTSCSTLEIGAVTLSADADPAPGGYIVPEGGNITFTCNFSPSESGGGVLWIVDFRVPGGRVTHIASQGLAGLLPQVTSPDTSTLANPASLTISNVTSDNNQSFVECFKEGFGLSNATIIVEGSPNCPTVNTTVNTVSLAVSIHKSLWRWLPEWYIIEVSSHFNGSIAMVYNSRLKEPASFEVTSLQPDTVYNITVIPCNMAGCNESCDVHSFQTTQTGNEESEDASWIIFTVIAVAVVIAIVIAIVCICKRMELVTWCQVHPMSCSGCLLYFRTKRLRKNGISDVVPSPPNELFGISTLREDQKSSSMDPVPIQQTSWQLQDATSATHEASQERGREATGRDVTM